MRRTATVIQAAPVNVPNSNEPAIRVITDYPRDDERAFYLRPDSPPPEFGSTISYGDDRAWYEVAGNPVVARKVGYNFDPYAPLR